MQFKLERRTTKKTGSVIQQIQVKPSVSCLVVRVLSVVEASEVFARDWLSEYTMPGGSLRTVADSCDYFK